MREAAVHWLWGAVLLASCTSAEVPGGSAGASGAGGVGSAGDAGVGGSSGDAGVGGSGGEDVTLREPADACFPESESECSPLGTWSLATSSLYSTDVLGDQFTVTLGDGGALETTLDLGGHVLGGRDEIETAVRLDENCRLVATAQIPWAADVESGITERALIVDLRGGFGRGYFVEEDWTIGQNVAAVRLVIAGQDAPDCLEPPPEPGELAQPAPETCDLTYEWRVSREEAPGAGCTNPAVGVEFFTGTSGEPVTQALRFVEAAGECEYYAEYGTLDAGEGTLVLRDRVELRTLDAAALVDMPGPCATEGLLPVAHAKPAVTWQMEIVDDPSAPEGVGGEPLFTIHLLDVRNRLRAWDVSPDVFVRSAPDAEVECNFLDLDEDGWISDGDAYDCSNTDNGVTPDDTGFITDVSLRKLLVDGTAVDLRPSLEWLVE